MVPDEPRPSPGDGGGPPRFGPAGVPIVAAPTIDTARSLVYVATGDSNNPSSQPLADAVVALDLEDGKVRWAKQLLVPDGGSSEFWAPAVLRAPVNGKNSILVGQRSGIAYSLDPDRGGEILWQTRMTDGKSAGGVGFGAAADHRALFVPISGPDADSSGSLAAIDIKTGAKRWLSESPTPACSWGSAAEGCSHAQTQAVTVIPGAAFSGSLDGHLRAYSTIDGRILWDYDTAKDFTTVNHVKAAGGSLDRGGPTIVNGVIFVNSGGVRRGQPGNVLLAFSVDGK